MTNIDAYNADLRARDAANARGRRPQPSGLAAWQARQRADEAAALAPYAIVKDGREYCITINGKGSEVNRYATRREALHVAQCLKQSYDARQAVPESPAAPEPPAVPQMKPIEHPVVSFSVRRKPEPPAAPEPANTDRQDTPDIMDMIDAVFAMFA